MEEAERQAKVTAEVRRKMEKAEEEARRIAALEKTKQAAEEQRLAMRKAYDDSDSFGSSYRSSSKLSWRDDDFSTDSFELSGEAERIQRLKEK